MKRMTRIIALTTSAVLLSQPAFSQIAQQVQFAQTNPVAMTSQISRYDVFKPGPYTDKRRLDYQVWDDILQKIVVDFGVSSRIRASRPDSSTGTRVVVGHSSPYRLEGSRIAFGYLDDNYRVGLQEYREDLVSLANQMDITRLSKDEQLAFWFNLHNIALIEQISKAYPEDRPSTITIDGVPFDEAKFMNIRGVDLSLKNIREDIVFSNWKDPKVIYGFFRGDIGSPRMMRYSFTANSLDYTLNGNASEFVNSLRGFHETRKARRVSAIYDEAKRFYFPNWEADLENHLRTFAEGKTLEDFESGKPFEIDKYETMIADLSGGQVRGAALFTDGFGSLPPGTTRLLSEVAQKEEILQQRGVGSGFTRGYVVIEDIETDPDLPTGSTIK